LLGSLQRAAPSIFGQAPVAGTGTGGGPGLGQIMGSDGKIYTDPTYGKGAPGPTPDDTGGTPPVDTGGTPPVDTGGGIPVDTGGGIPVDTGGGLPVDTGGDPGSIFGDIGFS